MNIKTVNDLKDLPKLLGKHQENEGGGRIRRKKYFGNFAAFARNPCSRLQREKRSAKT